MFLFVPLRFFEVILFRSQLYPILPETRPKRPGYAFSGKSRTKLKLEHNVNMTKLRFKSSAIIETLKVTRDHPAKMALFR